MSIIKIAPYSISINSNQISMSSLVVDIVNKTANVEVHFLDDANNTILVKCVPLDYNSVVNEAVIQNTVIGVYPTMAPL